MTNQLLIVLAICAAAVGGLMGWSMWLYGKGYAAGQLAQENKDEKVYKEKIDAFLARFNSGDPGYELPDGRAGMRPGTADAAGRLDVDEGCTGNQQGTGAGVTVYDKG